MCNLDSKGSVHKYEIFQKKNDYVRSGNYETPGPIIGTGRGMYNKSRIYV